MWQWMLGLMLFVFPTAIGFAEDAVLNNEGAEQEKVRHIGSMRQLFIDDYMIESMKSLKRNFHAARKHPKPVVVPDQPWEAVDPKTPCVYVGFGDVIWDEEAKQYKMWYTSWSPGPLRHMALYATSKDGIDWRKPLDLDIVKYKGSGANNILAHRCSMAAVLKLHSAAAAKRYQMFVYDRNLNGGRGAYAWRFSADGLHWSEPVAIPALAKPEMYDHGGLAYDEIGQRYVLAVKQHHSGSYCHPVLGKDHGRRWFMSTGTDPMTWTPLVDMLGDINAADKEYYIEGEGCSGINSYGFSLFSYHGVTLGMQWLFRVTDPKGFWNCQGGPMDGRLLFCRKWGEPWQVPTRQLLLPRGRKGNWDWGMICGITSRPVVSPRGDEWWYYYGGWDGGHGTSRRRACIGIAKFRIDGFASIGSVDTEGTLETPPLTFRGGELVLNVDAAGADTGGDPNYARVALLDSSGKAIPGYSLETCDPIQVNSVNHVVTWNGKGDISRLAERPVKMQIALRGAELYAFQYRETGEVPAD
jgi:hypothetical protein